MEERIRILMDLLNVSLKEYKLVEGSVITVVDKYHRIRISPYRITIEMRFPQGLTQNEIDAFQNQHAL